jgi:hypothetical protein
MNIVRNDCVQCYEMLRRVNALAIVSSRSKDHEIIHESIRRTLSHFFAGSCLGGWQRFFPENRSKNSAIVTSTSIRGERIHGGL